MKTNIFIHTGLHKTGSSSIQATLFKNRALLLKHDINYLTINQNHSTTLCPPLRKEMRRGRWKRLADIDTEDEALQYNAGLERQVACRLGHFDQRCGRSTGPDAG